MKKRLQPNDGNLQNLPGNTTLAGHCHHFCAACRTGVLAREVGNKQEMKGLDWKGGRKTVYLQVPSLSTKKIQGQQQH